MHLCLPQNETPVFLIDSSFYSVVCLRWSMCVAHGYLMCACQCECANQTQLMTYQLRSMLMPHELPAESCKNKTNAPQSDIACAKHATTTETAYRKLVNARRRPATKGREPVE